MTIALSRRAFIQASLSAAGGLAIAAFAPELAGATTIAGQPWSPETGKAPRRGQRLRRHRSRQFHHAPRRQVRHGSRRADLDGDDRCRGAGMRLRQGEGRIRFRQPEPHRQQCLSIDGHRRLPVGALFARLPAAGGRLGARAAHRRGRGEMERGARRVRRERRPRTA